MGTVLSRAEEPSGAISQELLPPAEDVNVMSDNEAEARKQQHEEDMKRFKAELAAKREVRKEALAGLNKRIVELKEELDKERMERQRLELELQEQGGEQGSRAEVEGLERQVKALKDVAAIGGEMLRIRELQVNELKEKLQAIEETGIAYEKEVESMRKLRGLYEERSRAMAISHQMEVEREKTRVVAAETRLEIAEEKNRELVEANNELKERVAALDGTVDKNNNEISDLKIQLAGKKEELYKMTSQMTIINNLFSQVLSDPESLDRVSRVLEEHHSLVNHLTGEGNINDVASVLMKVADKDHIMTEEEQSIAVNLSKVWRLLVELLGYHNKQTTGEPMPESCYKSVDTPSGPKLVISVSKTFLRLKDLILEKNSLVKEVGRLKDLNCHLEKRLISQESRLVEVAEELHKTWEVVNKLKSQHKALHTHEQVLRYELKHKRLMLNELKQQLEDCREMWQTARIKNNQTEKDWKILRKEFAARKQQASSAESGYEESPGDSQDEDDSHKMSDDESDIQDLHLSGNTSVLGLTRLEDSSQSTPNRSNTPDISITDCSVSEIIPDELLLITDNSELQAADDPPDVTLNEPEAENQSSEIISLFPSNNDRIITTNVQSDISSEQQDCHHTLSAPTLEFQDDNPEDLTVELDTTIQILPWNDSSESHTPAVSEEPVTKTLQKVGLIPANIIPLASKEEIKVQESVTLLAPTVTQTEHKRDADLPSCSNNTPSEETSVKANPLTSEEILARREARLKRLEEQCKNLFTKMDKTNKRSDLLSSKLVELHEHFGDSKGESSASRGSPAPQESCSPERPPSPSSTVNKTTEESDPALPTLNNTESTSVEDELLSQKGHHFPPKM